MGRRSVDGMAVWCTAPLPVAQLLAYLLSSCCLLAVLEPMPHTPREVATCLLSFLLNSNFPASREIRSHPKGLLHGALASLT